MNPKFIDEIIDMYLKAEVINKAGKKGVVEQIITHTLLIKFEGINLPIKYTFPESFEAGYLKLTDAALENKINDKLAKLQEKNNDSLTAFKKELKIEELKAKKKADLERKKKRELNKQKKITEENSENNE